MEPNYILLFKKWNPVRKSPQEVLFFCGFRGPPEKVESADCEVRVEHLSTPQVLNKEALPILSNAVIKLHEY